MHYTRVMKFLFLFRAHQWLKNSLLFVPLIAAHSFYDFSIFINVFAAFAAFSLAASAVYIFNDIIDLKYDKNHPIKSKRILASSRVSLNLARFLMVTLLILSIYISINYINNDFLNVLVLYVLLNIIYTTAAKKILVLDVLFLSFFYSIRVFAGAKAANIEISFWLLSMCVCLFLSLALLKRYSEIISNIDDLSTHRRAYRGEDKYPVMIMGISSGMLSIFVFMSYLNSTEVVNMYLRPEVIWFFIPIKIFWILRVWLFAARNEVNQDPLIFAVRDRSTWIILPLAVFLFFLAGPK